jgi:hypothetical protein
MKKSISPLYMLIGGLALNIIARFFPDDIIFQGLGVLGTLLFLFGIVGLISQAIKKTKQKKSATQPNSNQL